MSGELTESQRIEIGERRKKVRCRLLDRKLDEAIALDAMDPEEAEIVREQARVAISATIIFGLIMFIIELIREWRSNQ